MDLVDDYQANVWQTKYHASDTRHKLCIGGLGCLRASELVATSRGLVPIADIASGTEVWSYSAKGFRLSPSTCGFPKGKENLYRVVHERGEFFAAGHHLVFCDDYKYRRVDTLSLGRPAYSSILSATNEAPSRSGLPLDVPHWKGKLVDSLDRCGEDIRQYGRRLLDAVVSCLGSSPLQLDALGIALWPGPFQVSSRTHLARSHARLPRLDYILQMGVPELALAGRNASISFGHSFHESQVFPLSRAPSGFHLSDVLPDGGGDSVSSSCLTCAKSAILSIEKLPFEEWYFDIQVPGDNNYISGGAIHHNSGKTAAGCHEIKQLAIEYPGSRWIIGRKLLPSLRDSIWKDFLDMIPPEMIASYNKTKLDLVLKNGSEFLGRPLYDASVFKSYQIAGFLIEEADEIDKDIYDRLKDRLRQKLPNGSRPRYTSTLLCNPPEEDHWIVELFLNQRPANHEVFTSTTFDNKKNLPEEYIPELLETYSAAMLERLLYGRIQRVHKGRPVFPQFTKELYVKPVVYDPTLPLVRGWDFGYNHPACVFMQMKEGQVRILAEKLGKKIYLDKFVTQEVLPLQEQLFGNRVGHLAPVLDFCDPRGSDQTDKGITSVQILNSFQIYPVYRRTFIEEGIRAINTCLDTKDFKSGFPNFLIHPRCRILIEGFEGGYARLEGEETPDKDNYYDHLCDASRYCMIHLMTRMKARGMAEARSKLNVLIDPRTGRRFESA